MSKLGVTFRLLVVLSLPPLLFVLRLPRLGFLGNELVIELLVAVMKLLLAALRMGVGRARRIRCEVGIALVGGRVCDVPKTFIWDGGIHGARR